MSNDNENDVEQDQDIDSSEKDNPGVIALPPLIFIAFLALGILTNRIYPLHFINSPIRNIIGAIFAVYSVLTSGLAILQMRKAGTNVDVRKPSTTVVTDGIYRYTRNPMYVSLVLLLVALSVLLNNIWITILTPFFIIVIQKGVIEREESYLEGKFGTDYTSYKKRVRRWI